MAIVAFSNPSQQVPAQSPPANKNLLGELTSQLKEVQESLLNGKANLKTSEKNLETIEAEVETLKRLENDHVQLKSDIADQIQTATTKEKGKARQAFLFKASKLDAEVQKQLVEIRSRFAPLDAEKTSWSERKARYEAMISELSQKELTINEKLTATNEPKSAAANPSKSP